MAHIHSRNSTYPHFPQHVHDAKSCYAVVMGGCGKGREGREEGGDRDLGQDPYCSANSAKTEVEDGE